MSAPSEQETFEVIAGLYAKAIATRFRQRVEKWGGWEAALPLVADVLLASDEVLSVAFNTKAETRYGAVVEFLELEEALA